MEGYKRGLILNCALGWEQTESCQAKTSQATPTSQPQDLSQSKSQNCIYFFKPRQCVFNVCMCTSTCACLLSSDKSNRVIYTGGKSLLLRSVRHSLFIPMPIPSISQMTESSEGCRAVRPNWSVAVSYQGYLSAQQMDEEDQSTGKALPSRQV